MLDEISLLGVTVEFENFQPQAQRSPPSRISEAYQTREVGYRTFSLKEVFFTWAKLQKPKSLIHDVHALKGVSLSIKDGERIGIIGPNGAGKTTLLRAIAGIYPISSGTVTTIGTVRSLFEINLGFEYEVPPDATAVGVPAKVIKLCRHQEQS